MTTEQAFEDLHQALAFKPADFVGAFDAIARIRAAYEEAEAAWRAGNVRLDELTREDFIHPERNGELPALRAEVEALRRPIEWNCPECGTHVTSLLRAVREQA